MKEILDLNDLNLNDLSKNTIAQLREFGKELGIKSVTRYRKSELIDKIQEKLTEMSKSQMKQMEAEVPPEEQAAEGQEQAAAEQPVKKKRGRPKKSESESTSQTESQEEIVQITLKTLSRKKFRKTAQQQKKRKIWGRPKQLKKQEKKQKNMKKGSLCKEIL